MFVDILTCSAKEYETLIIDYTIRIESNEGYGLTKGNKNYKNRRE